MSPAPHQWHNQLRCPKHYDLARCVGAHGWHQLKPFNWDADRHILTTQLSIGSTHITCAFQQQKQQIHITCSSNKALDVKQQETVQAQTRYALMLDVDTSELLD